MKLGALIDGADLKLVESFDVDPDLEVSSVTADSREVELGALYGALPGSVVNGFDFIDDAVSKGAVAVVAERRKDGLGVAQLITSQPRAAFAGISDSFYGSPAKGLSITGITGTNGKTTTSYIIESIFKENALKCGVIGTVNYRYEGNIIESERTTPDSLELARLMRDMRGAGVTHLVMELSSHALKQRRADACRFSSAVFTNLTHEHLDYHKNMEDYYLSKARLFKDLIKDGGVAIVNIDDSWGRRLVGELSGATTFSMRERTDIYPLEYSVGVSGISATLGTPNGPVGVESALIGDYNLLNIMGAVGVAQAEGLDNEEISAGISALKNVPGRLDPVSGQGKRKTAPRFLVDYAHTPDALERSLGALKRITKGRLITVFGCGGDRDASKRPLMGKVCAGLCAFTVLTSDNPRGEAPEKILNDIEAGMAGIKRFAPDEEITGPGYTVIEDRRSAIRLAVSLARDGDTVLVAGKGHEDYQLVGGEKLSFDDKAELAGAINESGEARRRVKGYGL